MFAETHRVRDRGLKLDTRIGDDAC
jgi:hypothetical protein